MADIRMAREKLSGWDPEESCSEGFVSAGSRTLSPGASTFCMAHRIPVVIIFPMQACLIMIEMLTKVIESRESCMPLES